MLWNGNHGYGVRTESGVDEPRARDVPLPDPVFLLEVYPNVRFLSSDRWDLHLS